MDLIIIIIKNNDFIQKKTFEMELSWNSMSNHKYLAYLYIQGGNRFNDSNNNNNNNNLVGITHFDIVNCTRVNQSRLWYLIVC